MSVGTQGREAQRMRFRFDDVVIEPHGRRVFVGARERNVSRRAFDFLQILCEQPGRVLSRDELSERLWPGGQIVSDEALTQAIFRARSVLGAQGERIVTLRGVGIRFDAQVQREAVAAAASDHIVAPVTSPRSRKVVPILIGFALVLAALALWQRQHAAPHLIDAGYAINATDVHAAHADSERLLGEAIDHDNRGDRARARALLEALHDTDAQTPWPAVLLALWSVGAGDADGAQPWFARAHDRALPLHDPYVNAMLRYAEAERAGAAADVIRYAGAVLDLRPDAWRMYLARAHLMHAQGLRDAALAEIRHVDIHEFGNRKLESALADRASFGDVAGAQAILDRLPRTTDAAAWEYLAGRIAWSRGDGAAARAAWERAASESQRSGRSDIGNRAQANVGLAAMLAGDRTAAIAHFERARVGMGEAGWFIDEIDLSLLLAQLKLLDGHSDAARADFEHARSASAHVGAALRAQIALVGARLFPDSDVGDVQSPPAAQALLAARRARNRGDDEQARNALESSVQRGVFDLPSADEARLLAAELGQTVPPERPLDPPYPPLSAAAARVALAARPMTLPDHRGPTH